MYSGQFTVFGQLVSGFDTFEKIMTVPSHCKSVVWRRTQQADESDHDQQGGNHQRHAGCSAESFRSGYLQ